MISTNTAVFPTPLISGEKEGDASSVDLRRLTAAMVRGDDEAWSQFNRIYGPAIFRQLLALTRGDHDMAKEALQQTYLRVAKHIRPCGAEPMFKSWLRTVARTVLQDCWRRRRSFTELLFRKQQEQPELTESGSDNRLLDELDHALDRLNPADRMLLESKYLLGHNVREVAERLAISTKAVESRLTRARAALRQELLSALPRHE